MKIDTLLKAINMADVDGCLELSVTVADLQLLRREIYILRSNNDNLKREVNILEAKLSLRALDKPIKLGYYA